MAEPLTYLTLAADFGEVSIRDANSGARSPADLALPVELVDDLVVWNDRYQPVIAAEPEKRVAEPMVSLIADLDTDGLRLARRIMDSLGEGVKVRYFSEGLLREIA